MAKPTREDTFRVTVAIDGVDTGVWDKLSGGSGDSEEAKYRPGGMGPQIALGGSQTVENVTVSRYYDLERDGAQIKRWFARRGRALATITKQPLDIDANAYGEPLVYGQAVLKQVTPPDHDSESNDVGMLELEFSTSGTVA